MKTTMNADQLLAQMAQMRKVALGDAVQSPVKPSAPASNEFGQLLTNAVSHVNQLQMNSSQMAQQVETGDGGVSLVKAMIASQKANVAFQATVQVRNRLVSAYQDIMNMPI